jgi:ParB family chromosome partitioning protein
VVDDDKRLIAGQRRLEACKLLGWNTVAVHVVRLQNILRGECDENVVRADFTPSEQNSIAQALEERERLAAKERQSEAGKQFGRGIASAKFAQATEKGKSRANPSAQVCALVA